MRAQVDADRCGGHGLCAAQCPAVFAINDDGYADVLVAEVPPELEEAVLAAVRQCPEKAVSAT